MKKKLVGILVTVMVLVGMLPIITMPAFAYISSDDWYAFNIGSDTSLSSFLSSNEDLFDEWDDEDWYVNAVIDLQGHTLTIDMYDIELEDYNFGGFAIRNGKVTTSSSVDGECCFEINGGLELFNVTFENCNCGRLFYLDDCEYGAATFMVMNCTFKSCNFTENGGAFYFDYSDGYADLDFYNDSFIDCHTTGSGSIMYFNNVGRYETWSRDEIVYFEECNFANCSADVDGGAIYINDSNVDFVTPQTYGGQYVGTTVFYNCSAKGSGGAIYDDDGNGTIYNCAFYGCSAYSSSYGGGAILLDDNNRNLENCEFYGNYASREGGAIYVDASNCNVNNCRIINNSAGSGGAYYSYWNNNCKISNCTLSNSTNYSKNSGKPIVEDNCTIDDFEPIYRFSAENYDSNGNLCRGESVENPILIQNYNDLRAMALNIEIENATTGHGTWWEKYYSLQNDISGVYIRANVAYNHFMGEIHTVSTRLPESFLAANNGYAPGLIEYGIGGYSQNHVYTMNASWIDEDGNRVSGEAYVIRTFQCPNVLEDGKAYIVDANVSRTTSMNVKGDTSLILQDGYTLKLYGAGRINLGVYWKTFTICGSSDNMDTCGKLIVAPDSGNAIAKEAYLNVRGGKVTLITNGAKAIEYANKCNAYNNIYVRAGSDSNNTLMMNANQIGNNAFAEFFFGVPTTNNVTYKVLYDDTKDFTRSVKYMEKAVFETPEREGHDVENWYVDEKCTIPYDFNTPVSAPLTLYAKWKLQERTVTFDVQYDQSKNLTRKTLYSEPVEYVVPETRSGYTFINWCSDKECTNVFDFNTKIYNDTRLYALWEGDIKINFDVQYDNKMNIKKSVGPGETVSNVKPANREGYTFDGWYTTQACTAGTEYDFSTKLYKDLHLYAKWQKDRNIIFNYNDDGVTPFLTKTTPYKTVLKDFPSDPIRAGYTFMGWYNNSNYKIGDKFTKDMTVYDDMTLYAGWEADRIITFVFNNGTDNSEKEPVPYNTKSKYAKIPTKEGCGFMGWYTGENYLTSEKVDFSKLNITEDMTVYAGWDSNLDFEYIDSNGKVTKVNISGSNQICNTNPLTVFNGNGTNNWFVITEDYTASSRVVINGTVNLILTDGCTFNAPYGITLNSGNNLVIYGQNKNIEKCGKLVAKVDSTDAAVGSVTGAGSNNGYNASHAAGCGTLTIESGIVEIENTNGNGVGFGGGVGGYADGFRFDWYLPTYGRGGNGGHGGTLNVLGGSVSIQGGFKAFGGGKGGGCYEGGILNGGNGGDTNFTFGEGCLMKAGKTADTAIEVTGYSNENFVSIVSTKSNALGFTLSSGNIWIIGAGAVVIIGGLIALISHNKKKKMTE